MGVPGSKLAEAVIVVEAKFSKDKAELEAVCKAVSEELSERYPQYEAVNIQINDPRIKNRAEDLVGVAAYFRNEYSERDYVKLHGRDYNASC
jgi:dihydroneopterin aldolase